MTARHRINETREARRLKYMKLSLDIYGNKCHDCGNEDIRVLEFHHTIRNSNYKQPRVHQDIRNIANSGVQDPTIQLLCANCHILADHRDGTNNRASRKFEIYNFRKSQKRFGL